MVAPKCLVRTARRKGSDDAVMGTVPIEPSVTIDPGREFVDLNPSDPVKRTNRRFEREDERIPVRVSINRMSNVKPFS
jgi:hypothetical protein